MFLVGMVTWWYGRGWRGQLRRVLDRLASTLALFSVGQLLATLFSPFRQISAGRTDGPAGVQLRAFFDQLISRVVGAIVRTFTILTGLIVLAVQSLVEAIILLLWLLLPSLPVVGLVVMAIGWVPGWL